ncbi:DUF1659 domain-containing protein [Desulfofundulus thermocisternus]|jgi:hypothetical protein|uniref:DUF1659 domain-containing protein n=1 Tax=Desulfofundulus thermocisternus TaxID=42471 RepID=UPI000488AA87|nr:DUF1659 domain-containing protein [Desulfofundulus thermocisternus]
MAVNRVPGTTVLRLVLQTGMDDEGNPVYRNKNLNNIRPDAADQDLFDVAQALAGLQEYPLAGVNRIDNVRLLQA